MAQFFQLHPDNPQLRLIRQTVDHLRQGGVIALPTDASFVFACQLDDKQAVTKLRQLRQLDERHHLALLCPDLTVLGHYARVSNVQYRVLKAIFPGPYTVILSATRELPRRVSHPQKKTVGLRVPAHPVVQTLLAEMAAPLIATTLQAPGEDQPMHDVAAIRARYEHDLAVILDDGLGRVGQTTTVIDWSDEPSPRVVRLGVGELQGPLESIPLALPED